MKRILTVLVSILMCFVLISCQKAEEPQTGASSASASAEPEGNVSEKAPGEDKPDFSKYEIDPPYDFDPETMVPRDFGDYFAEDYPGCTVETYKLAEGTEVENEVTKITGSQEGNTVYVIAGVHGDEQAAWRTGKLLKKISIQAGTLYIIAPANPWGAYQETPTRYVTGEEDLNRSFPGSPDGTMAEKAAAAIYADVERVQPDFVFDLHEARVVKSSRDFLGSSLIFSSLDGMEDMFMDMVMETELGNLCSEPFKFYSPGPAGSVNRTITEQLHIPTVTVETFRGYQMERRIGDQLAVVQYVLQHYGLTA